MKHWRLLMASGRVGVQRQLTLYEEYLIREERSPATVKYKKRTFNVSEINTKVFYKNTRKVTVGKNVDKIKKQAFKGSKVTTVIIKTKDLTKARVKGSLKGSKVTTVKVKVGSKKANRTYIKKYKKIFTKKNAGKKVKVK